jgi:imidazolonepropionase-like amidohydrolase
LGISDVTGSLVAGKSADLIGVSGDPLTDIETTKHPVFVMKEGKIFVTRTLSDSVTK